MNFLFFFPLQQQLPMEFSATTDGKKWKGEALVPWAYFPPNVNKMNSYAIHGSGENRTYEALFPIPKDEIVEGQKPDLWVDLRLQSQVSDDMWRKHTGQDISTLIVVEWILHSWALLKWYSLFWRYSQFNAAVGEIFFLRFVSTWG